MKNRNEAVMKRFEMGSAPAPGACNRALAVAFDNSIFHARRYPTRRRVRREARRTAPEAGAVPIGLGHSRIFVCRIQLKLCKWKRTN